MRTREPDGDGFVEHDGVKIHYEVYGDGDTTILLLPTWPIVHKRLWKMQVPYLARHHRVVTYDGPGNGRSDRPCITIAGSVPLRTADPADAGEDAFLAAPPDLPPSSVPELGRTRRRTGRSGTGSTGWTTTRTSPCSSSGRCSPSPAPPRGSRTPSAGPARPPRRCSWPRQGRPRRPARTSRTGAPGCAVRCCTCTAATTASSRCASARSWLS